MIYAPFGAFLFALDVGVHSVHPPLLVHEFFHDARHGD